MPKGIGYNKNIIGDLRGKFDPHYKLASNVEGLEKGLVTEVSQLHKTLSKSFGMQRKTLSRVLGLEERVAKLEEEREEIIDNVEEIVEDIVEDILEEEEEDEEEIPAELDDLIGDVRGQETEIGGDEGSPSNVVVLDGEKKPPFKINRRKIKPEDIKQGTPLDDDFKSRVFGEDDKGGYLSKEERIARFKGETFNPESLKPLDEGSSEEGTSEGEGKAENVLSGMGKSISTIADTVDSIFNTLKEQFEEQKDTKEDARVRKEQKDAEKDEKKLEGKGKIGKALEGASKKVMAPFQSIWDKFVNFLTTILFGKVLMKIMDWFGNPENADRIKSFVRFLIDWWPVLLASAMAFLPALFGTGGMIIGTVVLISWALPKVINAVKWLMGLPGQIGKFLMGGDKENQKLDKEVDAEFTDAGKSLNKEIGMSTDLLQDEKEVKSDPRQQAEQEQGKEKAPIDIKKQQEQQQQKEPVGLNKGGTVPGKGDKDTVPAMLTPGEFVMTKGAVQKFGVDTLEGMNAAAGGTNIPVVQIEEKKKKESGMGMGGIRGSIPAYSSGGKGMNMMIPRYNGGGKVAGVVTDPKEKARIEAETLKWVNKERVEFLGLPPLDKITYAEGVELTKAMGPEYYGKGIIETSDTQSNFDTMTKTTWKTKSRGAETIFQGSVGRLTEEDKQAYLDSNPNARLAQVLQQQIEMDNLGADISASAKMNGGGLVSNLYNSISNFNGGGLVQGFAGGGLVRNFNQGGMVNNMFGGAKTAFNMLPQVRAAKFVGGGLFKGIKNVIGKGKEVLGGMGAAGAAGAAGAKGADGSSSGLFSGFFSKVSKVPLVGPILVSAGKDLVSGIDNLIVQKHLQLHESSSSTSDISQLKMSTKTLKTSDIAPPSGKNVKVINQKSSSPSSAASPAPMIGSGDIPDFAVVHPARRTAKQKTLGITN